MMSSLECPKCRVVGYVYKRKDAYVNFPVSSTGIVDMDDATYVSLFDFEFFQCLSCGASLEPEEIEEHNRIKLSVRE